MVDSRHEQVLDEWLYQIRYTVGSQAKVIIVTNWFENCEILQNQRYLLRKYRDILEERSFFYFSLDALLYDDCSEPVVLAFENFVKTLWDFSLDSQRFALKRVLDAHKKINNEFKGNLFVRKSMLLSFLKCHEDSLDADDVILQLEKLGFILRVAKDCRAYCLKPGWLMEYSYRLSCLDELIAGNGVLSWDKLVVAAQEDGLDEDILIFLLDFLQDQGVCKKLYFNNQDLYFITYSCNPNEHEFVNKVLHYKVDKKAVICFDLPYFPLGLHAYLVSALFRQDADFGITHFDDIWKSGFLISNNGSSHGVVQFFRQKYIVEITLVGEPSGCAKIMKNFYAVLVNVLTSHGGFQLADIHPFVVFNKEITALKTGGSLIKILETIDGFDQLFQEVKKMAGKTHNETHYHGDVTHNTGGDGSNFATNSENFTQNSHVQALEVHERQQIEVIVNELLKNAGSLAQNPEALSAVAEVNKALAAPPDDPKARNLLGSVWNGLKEVLGATKTTTEIAKFAMEHQVEIATAITAAIALLK